MDFFERVLAGVDEGWIASDRDITVGRTVRRGIAIIF